MKKIRAMRSQQKLETGDYESHSFLLSSDKFFLRIDKLKESSEYNVVYGSHVSLTKDSAFKS